MNTDALPVRKARARLLSAWVRVNRQTDPPHHSTREWKAYVEAKAAFEAAQKEQSA